MEPNLVNRKRILSNPLFKTTFLDKKNSVGDVPNGNPPPYPPPIKKPALKVSDQEDDNESLSIDDKSSNEEELSALDKESVCQKKIAPRDRYKSKLHLNRRQSSKPTIALFKKEHFYQIDNNDAGEEDNVLNNLDEENYFQNMKIQSKINKILSSSSVKVSNTRSRMSLAEKPVANGKPYHMPLYSAVFVVASIIMGFVLQYTLALLLFMKANIDEYILKAWHFISSESFYKKKLNLMVLLLAIPLVLIISVFYASFWLLHIMNKALLTDISFNFLRRLNGGELWSTNKTSFYLTD